MANITGKNNPNYKPVEIRFWEKVDKRGKDECWEWQGGLKRGYGSFWDGNKQTLAHRFSWKIHNKLELPKGLFVCHHCDNPSCINPKHLFLGTHSDNMKDAYKKGRVNPPPISMKGTENKMAKLTEETVNIIRSLYKRPDLTQRKIAHEFNISKSTVQKITSRNYWKHVK